MKAFLQKYWWMLVSIGVLLTPIVVYMHTFGIRVSNRPEDWGTMGSAMSGIYSPILALLTLIVLLFQFKLQRQLNEHTIHQAHADTFGRALDDQLQRLESALNEEMRDVKVGELLRRSFGNHVRADDLFPPIALSKEACGINAVHGEIFSAWVEITTILMRLGADSELLYQLTFDTARSKLVTSLSNEVCWALDTFVWALHEGDTNLIFQFSGFLVAQNRPKYAERSASSWPSFVRGAGRR